MERKIINEEVKIVCKGIEDCTLLPDSVKKTPMLNGIKFIIDKRAKQIMYRDKRDNLTVYCFTDLKDLFKHLEKEILEGIEK